MTEIPTKTENPSGLHQRYLIRKIVKFTRGTLNWSDRGGGDRSPDELETKPIDADAEYFVLRLDIKAKDINHVRACRIAIHAYAAEIEKTIPNLAKDLRERYPLIP